jgi:hypothetical protein
MNPQRKYSLRSTQFRPKAKGDKPEQNNAVLPLGCRIPLLDVSVAGIVLARIQARAGLVIPCDSSFLGKACPEMESFRASLTSLPYELID